MKEVLLTAWLLLMVGEAIAQEVQKNPTSQKTMPDKNAVGKKEAGQNNTINKNTTATDSVIILSSTSSHNALGSSENRFRFIDPVPQTLYTKTGRMGAKVEATPLPGVPKGTYGFADGRLTLYSSGATSSGTITGTGSVGTGTSPGSIGTFASGIGVNGKSPYTSYGPYGTRIPTVFSMPDSSAGSRAKKRF